MSKYVVAIDQGTSSTRAIIINHSSATVAMCQVEHRQIYPQPGWVEHDALELWENTQKVLNGVVVKAGILASDIAAAGVANQRETTVIRDKITGKPLHNAIVWLDTRNNALVEVMVEKYGKDDWIRVKTGLPFSTYFSGLKVKWLIDNVAEVRRAVDGERAFFGTIDTWLIWNLTGGINGGVHITDPTNASRTMLMNIRTLKWDDEICNAFDIPISMLPEICSSSEIYGYTSFNGAFMGKVPIAGCLGDQQAAAVGQACLEGEAKNTYGTGCFMIMNTGDELKYSRNGLLSTVCYKFGNENQVYGLEGSIAIAGLLVQWLRDNFGMISTASEVEELALSVADNGGIYFVPAFSGLYAPYWRSDARGIIAGITHNTNRGHLARAVLEATAYQTKDVVEAMNTDSRVELKSLKVDGGMVKNELLMQFQADVLGIPVICSKFVETTSLGCAYAAGLAVGYWYGKDDIRSNFAEKNGGFQIIVVELNFMLNGKMRLNVHLIGLGDLFGRQVFC